MGRSLKVARIAGIPIGIQPLWLVIVGLITWSLGDAYYPDEVPGIAPASAYALGLASALLLFASILLHELGHAIVARRRGLEVEEIDLWLLGGVARMAGHPRTGADELRFALAGPAVTAALAAAFGALALALPDSAPAALRAVISYQAFVNAAILAFNLLPAFPLDGGRVTRALLWMRGGDLARATRTAAGIGRGFGYGLIGLGAFAALGGLVGGLWLALIGIFVIAASRAEENGTLVRTALGGRAAGNLATLPAVTIPARITVAEAIHDYFVPRRFAAFPVLDGERVIGLLDAATVEEIPVGARETTSVREATIADRALIFGAGQDVASLYERPAFQRVGRAVVVARDGSIGIVSITDVRRVLRALELGGLLAPRPRSA